MKKIILIICIFLFINYINGVSAKEKNIIIPNDAIRLRVLANSNSEYDQSIKIKVSIKIQDKLKELLKDTKNINEAKTIIKNNINNLNNYIKSELQKEHYNKNISIMYGNNFFPNKKYKDVIYKKGYYDSIVIKIGEGKGNNWWCVLFPPLCLMEVDESNIEYKYYVKEIIDKYL